MKIQIDTHGYNDRRYGKPWIALVDFSGGAKGEFKFGEWCGQAGEQGTLYMEAEPGDVVATGQKDFRNPRKSAPEFYMVEADGKLEACSKADAYKHWQAAAIANNSLTKWVGSAMSPEFAPVPLDSLSPGVLSIAALVVEAEDQDSAHALVREWHRLANELGDVEHETGHIYCVDACRETHPEAMKRKRALRAEMKKIANS